MVRPNLSILLSTHSSVSWVAINLLIVLFLPLDSVTIWTKPTVSISIEINFSPTFNVFFLGQASQDSIVPFAASSVIALVIVFIL